MLLLQDYYQMPSGSATTMAHEMGHNLGFEHDNELPGPCDCTDDTGFCIMDAYIQSVV